MRFLRQELRLHTRDMPRTIEFYRDLLGFTVDSVWGPVEAPEGCILDHGDVHFLFHRDGDSEPRLTGVVVVQVEGVLELHERLAGKAKVVWGPEVYSYGMRRGSERIPHRVLRAD